MRNDNFQIMREILGELEKQLDSVMTSEGSYDKNEPGKLDSVMLSFGKYDKGGAFPPKR